MFSCSYFLIVYVNTFSCSVPVKCTSFNVKSSLLSEIIDKTNGIFLLDGLQSAWVGTGSRKGPFCSVSVDRLDYDCLTGSVDVCVSSLSASRYHLCAQRSSKSGHAVWSRSQPAPSCFNNTDTVTSQAVKLHMKKGLALCCSELYTVGHCSVICMIGTLDHNLDFKCSMCKK